MGSAATLAMMQALAMGVDAWGAERPAEQLHVPRPPAQPRNVPRAAGVGGIGSVGGVRRLQISEKPPPRRQPKVRSYTAAAPRPNNADRTPRAAGRSGGASERRAVRGGGATALRGTPQASKSERDRELTEQARGGIKSARTPRMQQVRERIADGPPKQCHVFLTRKSKGVPMKNPMPRLKAKASPLVAAINMHERGFERRRMEYDARRKRRLQEEIEEDTLRRQEEAERQRAKLDGMKKDRERALAQAFGDAEEFDAQELERIERVLQEKAEKRKKRKAKQRKKQNKPKPPKPVPLTKEQKRERRKAMVMQHEEKRRVAAVEIQAHFRAFVGRKVFSVVKEQAIAFEQQERDEVVRTVVEQIVNHVEMDGIDARINLLKQIEELQQQNRKAIDTIDKVLVASSTTDGSWAIPWPPPEIADHNDGPNFKDAVDEHNQDWAAQAGKTGVTGARKFARLFIDRVLDDVVIPHAFERVIHRRQVRAKATLEENFGVEGQSGVSVDATGISGLWRAFGSTKYGLEAEEFLQLRVADDGTVTGMVDSDGDGIWTEADCRLANGFFDGATCLIQFDQVYDDNPTEQDRCSGFDKTRWEAVYDPSSDKIVKGQWSTAAGSAGIFECERTTANAMRNRRQPNSTHQQASPTEPEPGFDGNFELHTPGELGDHGIPSITGAELEAAAEDSLKDEAGGDAARVLELRKLAAEQGISVEDLEKAMGLMDQVDGTGTDLSAIDWSGNTAAHETAAGGKLSAAGADPAAIDWDGQNAANETAAGGKLGPHDEAKLAESHTAPAAAGADSVTLQSLHNEKAAEAETLTEKAAEAETLAESYPEDPEVADQAKLLEEVMKMAHASGLVRGFEL